MIRGCAAILLLASVVGCGEPGGGSTRTATARSAPAATFRILDPGGRLVLAALEPEAWLVDAGGVAAGLGVWWLNDLLPKLDEMPSAGTRLLVVAPGCLPALSPVGAGTNVVRLSAGHRVRLTFVGERPALPPGTSLGFNLSRRVRRIEGITLPSDVTLTAVAAATYDEDAPAHSQYVRIPPSGALDVLVPGPGRYEFGWDMRRGNRATSFEGATKAYDLDPDRRALEIPWAVAGITRGLRWLSREER